MMNRVTRNTMTLWRRLGLGTAALLAALPCAFAQPAGDLAECIETLRRELPQHAKVRRDTFDTHTRGAQDLRPLIDNATRSQPEFKLAIWDYVARLVDPERVQDGRAILEREAQALAAIAARHKVDAATVVAVFGVETDYGRRGGRYPVVDATLSRACLNLQSRERKAHFFAALWLLQEGLVHPEAFRGSWAGAFGQTQFMPGTFVEHMDDGDGSGSVDIIGSTADALATTARYLRGLGWSDGLPWGQEVALTREPQRNWAALAAAQGEHACLSAAAPAGRCRSIAQWSALGLVLVDGKPLALPPSTSAALLLPSGPQGPAWVVTRNYRALWQYNRADAYALSIGLLSNALRGEPAMATPWPTDDLALARAEMRELQALLRRRGHCDVAADGFDGPRTAAAVRSEERARGRDETGRAGAAILRLLKAEADAASTACEAGEPLNERAGTPSR